MVRFYFSSLITVIHSQVVHSQILPQVFSLTDRFFYVPL